eukprot:scaffold109221_cov32-Tisochrysis_lutea.AAC.3
MRHLRSRPTLPPTTRLARTLRAAPQDASPPVRDRSRSRPSWPCRHAPTQRPPLGPRHSTDRPEAGRYLECPRAGAAS